jgi:hypothetical protein
VDRADDQAVLFEALEGYAEFVGMLMQGKTFADFPTSSSPP